MSPPTSDVRPWLLVEASQEGVMRFATAVPSLHPRIGHIREINIAGLPTLTDALQQFERDSGIPLRGLKCAIAMAGATSGEALSMVRSRWMISRAGLEAVFGRPVTVLNDVAARSWGTRSGTATIESLRGGGAPSLNRPGRYLMIMVEQGVGASAVDVDRDCRIRILDTEAGHLDFAPSSPQEERLANAVRGTAPHVSWERLLMLDRYDPVWAQACPELEESDRPRMLAALLGRFTVNLMHGFGAWQGAMLTGQRASRILDRANRTDFEAAFNGRRSFSRLITGTPVWQVEQHEAVLTGAAECLASGFELGFQEAA